MKCFVLIIGVVVAALAVNAEESIPDSELSPTNIEIVPVNQEKKQEKRGIGYNSLGGYTSGLGVDGSLGYVGGGIGGYNSALGVNGYNYGPYTPPRVAGLGAISGYTSPGYYSSGYNTGYNGYNGYNGYGGYSGGYPGSYTSSRLGYPYYRQGYYNSYPSSYYNSNFGSSIVGGGLGGIGGVPATVPVVGGGYQYGPGISGGIY